MTIGNLVETPSTFPTKVVLCLLLPSIIGAAVWCWAGTVYAERGRRAAELTATNPAMYTENEAWWKEWEKEWERRHRGELHKDDPHFVFPKDLMEKDRKLEQERQGKARKDELDSLNQNFFTIITYAVWGSYWNGVGVSAALVGILGLACWGVRGLGERSATAAAPTAGYGPLGALIGAIFGSIAGLVAGWFSGVLPLGVWFAFYGLLFGFAFGLTLALIPPIESPQ